MNEYHQIPHDPGAPFTYGVSKGKSIGHGLAPWFRDIILSTSLLHKAGLTMPPGEGTNAQQQTLIDWINSFLKPSSRAQVRCERSLSHDVSVVWLAFTLTTHSLFFKFSLWCCSGGYIDLQSSVQENQPVIYCGQHAFSFKPHEPSCSHPAGNRPRQGRFKLVLLR